ncbi:MAG: hypothetical protein ABIR28_09335 [Vicinamibacteria bacterium]
MMSLLESHLVALVLFSGFTATVMGTLAEDTPRERVISSLKMFAAFVAATVVGAWIMHFVR